MAVKRFIKQNLDEKMMLEFRAEMAFLSELHHPNIVLFIGKTFLTSSFHLLPFSLASYCVVCVGY